jgi:hypothetical protein
MDKAWPSYMSYMNSVVHVYDVTLYQLLNLNLKLIRKGAEGKERGSSVGLFYCFNTL